jgi:hypothetical protein
MLATESAVEIVNSSINNISGFVYFEMSPQDYGIWSLGADNLPVGPEKTSTPTSSLPPHMPTDVATFAG